MLIVFDLDGTLIDSIEDLTASANAMRVYFGMKPLDVDLVRSYVGNGAKVLVEKVLGAEASDQTVKAGLTYFLDHYREHSLDATRLYAGVQELLEDLRSADHTLAVLSNKPAEISRHILDGLQVSLYFFRIYGGDSFSTRKPDPLGLLSLIEESALDHEQTMLLGDSPVDVETARRAGVRCCGVTWGFQPGALKSSGPDLLISAPGHLLAYI